MYLVTLIGIPTISLSMAEDILGQRGPLNSTQIENKVLFAYHGGVSTLLDRGPGRTQPRNSSRNPTEIRGFCPARSRGAWCGRPSTQPPVQSSRTLLRLRSPVSLPNYTENFSFSLVKYARFIALFDNVIPLFRWFPRYSRLLAFDHHNAFVRPVHPCSYAAVAREIAV